MANHAWICPTCKLENPETALSCSKCGTPAPPSTMTVTGMQPPRRSKKPTGPLPAPLVEGLALYLKDHPDPIVIPPTLKTVLGRQTSAAVAAGGDLLDLSEYNAYQLGVSRHHAEISYYDRRAAIKDLGSANGTWLNGQRLLPHHAYPVKDGDQINLGRLECQVRLGVSEKNTPSTDGS